jgi:cupin superfamily acireductone dioxygenase involved in methionine salvage
VRVRLEKDDLLILPAGIYHRFTTDESNVSRTCRCLLLPTPEDKHQVLTGAYSMCMRCDSSRTSPSGHP